MHSTNAKWWKSTSDDQQLFFLSFQVSVSRNASAHRKMCERNNQQSAQKDQFSFNAMKVSTSSSIKWCDVFNARKRLPCQWWWWQLPSCHQKQHFQLEAVPSWWVEARLQSCFGSTPTRKARFASRTQRWTVYSFLRLAAELQQRCRHL